MGNIGNYRGVSFNKKVTPFVLLGVFKESWRLVFDDKLPLFTKKDVVLLGKILKHYKKEIAVQYVVDVVLDWNKLRIRFPKLYGKPNVGVLFGWRGVFMEYIESQF